MAHQAIYRKWRPMVFDDVVGQTHITRTLKNQVMSGTEGHAYLFCGTRGTGKTTCAKILSRAVNCLHPKDGNPCNECEICRGIIDGSIMDVVEMDAASNNKVDDIRGVLDDVNYMASTAKYTVYIIDEVHMLSTSAFNALLKTLEEPPENVIFILATTEPHKVPQTILSRCQRFDFRRISADDIAVRMKEIAYADGYNITDGAVRMLASLADGSMRDGLSIMERVIAASGSEVTETDVVNTLGISTLDSVFELTDAIIDGDAAGVVASIDKALADGKNLTQLSNSVLEHFRALMICKLSPDPETLLEYEPQTIVRMKAQSEKLTFEKLNHAASVISAAQADAKAARVPRLIYELAYIKLARPETDRSPEAIADRLAAVELKLESGAPAVRRSMPAAEKTSGSGREEEIIKRLEAVETAIKNGVKASPEQEKPAPPEKKKLSARLYVPIPESELTYDYPTAKLARNWSNTINTMKHKKDPYFFPLMNCVVTFDAEGLIVLVPDDRYDFTQVTVVNHLDRIRAAFQEVTGTDYTIKIARRSDFDDRQLINPFELPKRAGTGDMADDTAPVRETPAASAPSDEKSETKDPFDRFLERFSDIIVDADKLPREEFDREAEAGVQTELSMDDDEEEPEEFLEEDELRSENEDEGADD